MLVEFAAVVAVSAVAVAVGAGAVAVVAGVTGACVVHAAAARIMARSVSFAFISDESEHIGGGTQFPEGRELGQNAKRGGGKR